jgi:hypothetical protein
MATLSTMNFALKELFSKGNPEQMMYKDNPLLAMVKKDATLIGRARDTPVRFAHTNARSGDFATAQAGQQASSTRGVVFVVPRVKDYQLFEVDNELIEASMLGAGSWLPQVATELQSALANMGHTRSFDLYRDSVGSRAQVAAITGVGPFVVTLVDPSDIVHFEVGQVLTTAATRIGALRNVGAGVSVLGVDRENAVPSFTITTNPDGIVANDFLFIKGDRIATALTNANSGLRLHGLEAWNPGTAPDATLFCQVDRSVDPSRLGGLRIDVSSLTPEEGLAQLVSVGRRNGSHMGHMFMNNADFLSLRQSLTNRVEMEYVGDATIGFDAIKVRGGNRPLMVLEDPNCPVGIGRGLDLDTWCLSTTPGGLAKVQDLDGAIVAREPTRDSWSGRITFYGNLECNAPGMNARVLLPR